MATDPTHEYTTDNNNNNKTTSERNGIKMSQYVRVASGEL